MRATKPEAERLAKALDDARDFFKAQGLPKDFEFKGEKVRLIFSRDRHGILQLRDNAGSFGTAVLYGSRSWPCMKVALDTMLKVAKMYTSGKLDRAKVTAKINEMRPKNE